MKLKSPLVLVLVGQAVLLVAAVVVFAVSQSSHAAPSKKHKAADETEEVASAKKHGDEDEPEEEAPKKKKGKPAAEPEEDVADKEEPAAEHHGRHHAEKRQDPEPPTHEPPAAEAEPKHADPAPEPSFEAVVNDLVAGNGRFVDGATKQRDLLAVRKASAEKDEARAVVVTCTDSRVSPELIFDQPVGVLEVVRVPGAQLDAAGVKTVEQAVKRLHAKVVLVMGHAGCAHVQDAKDHAPKKMPRKVTTLSSALAAAHDDEEATQISVGYTVQALRKSRVLAGNEDLAVLRLVYAPATGAVTWLDAN